MNIEKEELIRRLKIAEPYNNKDVPQYVWSIINAIPDAERKGKWILHLDDLFPVESTMECNQCHKHQPCTIDDNYCPNCGADMRNSND